MSDDINTVSKTDYPAADWKGERDLPEVKGELIEWLRDEESSLMRAVRRYQENSPPLAALITQALNELLETAKVTDGASVQQLTELIERQFRDRKMISRVALAALANAKLDLPQMLSAARRLLRGHTEPGEVKIDEGTLWAMIYEATYTTLPLKSHLSHMQSRLRQAETASKELVSFIGATE